MALLFAADRIDHLEREIEPALARGAIVVSDRYDLSTIVYQSATCPEGDGAVPWLRELNEKARRPDLILVVDVAPEVAEARRKERAAEPEIFEKSDLQRRLAHLYKRAREFLPEDRIELVSGEGEVGEVTERLWKATRTLPEFGTIEPRER